MHYSAKRGLAIVYRLSVRMSDVRAIWRSGQYGAEPHYSMLPFWQLCALKG